MFLNAIINYYFAFVAKHLYHLKDRDQLNNLSKSIFIYMLFVIIGAPALLAQVSIKKNVFFDYDSSSLRQESKITLNLYIKQLMNNPDLYIRVTGYSDSKGSSDYNKKLSEGRVKSVVGYLKEKGIEQERIKSRSLGSTTRFSKGESEKSLEMNRRVEIVLIKKEAPAAVTKKKKEQSGEVVTKPFDNSFINVVEIENVVSHELKKIAAENIELTVPAEMKQGKKSIVEASVSESFIIKLIKRLDNTTYRRISPVSDIDIKKFSLYGSSFVIKKIEGEKLGEWKWEVTPAEPGTASLTLAADMNIKSNKTQKTLNIPIFLKAVNVKSKPTYYLSKIMSKGLYIIFFLVLALGIFTMLSKKDNSTNIKKD